MLRRPGHAQWWSADGGMGRGLGMGTGLWASKMGRMARRGAHVCNPKTGGGGVMVSMSFTPAWTTQGVVTRRLLWVKRPCDKKLLKKGI